MDKIEETTISPVTITYTTEDGKEHIDVITKAYVLENDKIKSAP